MKTYLSIFVAVSVACVITSGRAQPGSRGMMGGPPGPRFGRSMTKVFGENSNFTAEIEVHGKGTSVPGQISYSDGNSRFEMDLTKATGPNMRPGMAEQMKAMGMDKSVMISRPDKKVSYLVYPGFESYVESPLQDASGDTEPDKLKMETTELGKETLDGHACVKNKVVITDDKGNKKEMTIWNATDLKNFPIKIAQTDGDEQTETMFKNVKLAKPDKAQFDPPAAFKKYDNQGELMREQMMKRMGAGGGRPLPPPTQK